MTYSLVAYTHIPLVSRVSALSERARVTLLRRIEGAGLPVVRSPSRGLPYDFLGEGICLHRGILLWDEALANIDALCHEVGHALQIPRARRETWTEADMRTDESLAMAVQVELQRAIPGLGVWRAIAMMERIGYWGGCGKGSDGCRWWFARETREEREIAASLLRGEAV